MNFSAASFRKVHEFYYSVSLVHFYIRFYSGRPLYKARGKNRGDDAVDRRLFYLRETSSSDLPVAGVSWWSTTSVDKMVSELKNAIRVKRMWSESDNWIKVTRKNRKLIRKPCAMMICFANTFQFEAIKRK